MDLLDGENAVNDEMIKLIIVIAGTAFGFTLSEISSLIKRRINRKEKLILANYNMRLQSYNNLYIALDGLENYLRKFLDSGNDYIEQIDPSEFAPLREFTKLNSIITVNQIWFSQPTIIIVNEFMNKASMMNGLATAISGSGQDDLFTSQVEVTSKNMIDEIQVFKSYLRNHIGITDLDKIQKKLIK